MRYFLIIMLALGFGFFLFISLINLVLGEKGDHFWIFSGIISFVLAYLCYLSDKKAPPSQRSSSISVRYNDHVNGSTLLRSGLVKIKEKD